MHPLCIIWIPQPWGSWIAYIRGLLKPGSGELSVPNHPTIGQHVNRHDLLVAGFIDVFDEAQMAERRLPAPLYSMSILRNPTGLRLRRLETVPSMMILTVDGMLEADMRVGHLRS